MYRPITRRAILANAAAAGAGLVAGPLLLKGLKALSHRPVKNVLFLLADAFRADRLSAMRAIDGAVASLTPNLDRFLSSSVVFERAIAPSCWTPLSIASFFYRVPANLVSLSHQPGSATGPSRSTLASDLRDAGYRTCARIANRVIDFPMYAAGFEDFRVYSDFTPPRFDRCSSTIVRETLSIADTLRAARSYFLYVHFMDTHEPYFSPDISLRRLGGVFNPAVFTTRLNKHASQRTGELIGGLSLEKALVQLQLHYDAAAMFLDNSIGRLLDRFDEMGLLDDTLVIFTSDHGEEFADNQEQSVKNVGHARNLTLPEIHSPLLFWRRDFDSVMPRAVAAPVSLTDTLREFIDYHVDSRQSPLIGSLLAGSTVPSAPILSFFNHPERFNGFSMVDGQLKLQGHFSQTGDIADAVAGRILPDGALQRVDLPTDSLARVASMMAGNTLAPFNPDALDEDARRKIEALGYLGG